MVYLLEFSLLSFGRFFSNVCFLLGAAYFVSGSYPEKTILAGIDDDSEGSHFDLFEVYYCYFNIDFLK